MTRAALSSKLVGLTAATLAMLTGLWLLPIARCEEVDFGYGPEGLQGDWVKAIEVLTPKPRANVDGKIIVRFRAPRMRFAEAFCWHQPTASRPAAWGHDVSITGGKMALDDSGEGSFELDTSNFPHGPLTVRIFAHAEGLRDLYELQLYNNSGTRWNEGIPAKKPAAAKNLNLIFQDDFTGALSISGDGQNTRYTAHKPRSGDFSGWPFTSPRADGEPFLQKDTWLRIRAAKDASSPKGRTGLLASVNMQGKGIWAKSPAYFEARLIAQSAPGTWPAFWTVNALDRGQPSDELDIIEAYGGVGKGNPNHPGYHVVTHLWGQKDADGAQKRGFSALPLITKLGGGSSWSTTFHVYGVSIGLTDTVYYFDNIEVLRHPTGELSRKNPHFFMLNYAIGGASGWPVDLERYGNESDMYVDYVRVYAKPSL